jgi:hypothetical protein
MHIFRSLNIHMNSKPVNRLFLFDQNEIWVFSREKNTSLKTLESLILSAVENLAQCGKCVSVKVGDKALITKNGSLVRADAVSAPVHLHAPIVSRSSSLSNQRCVALCYTLTESICISISCWLHHLTAPHTMHMHCNNQINTTTWLLALETDAQLPKCLSSSPCRRWC